MSAAWTPLVKIEKGGVDITSNFQDLLLSVEIESVDGGGTGDRATIVLDDRDWQIASPSTSEANPTVLAISLGYAETGLWPQGTFQANETTYALLPRTMTLLCSSFGFDGAGKSPVIVSHEAKTLGQIVSDIASSAGVAASVDPDLAAIQIPYLNQTASSLHLLQDLERRFSGLAKFADGRLSFTKRATGLNASGKSIGRLTLGPSDFGSLSITETSRPAFSKVRASWWDKDAHQLQWTTSTTTPATDSTAPFMLKRAFASQAEAQAGANAMMGQLNRGVRTGTLTLAKGDPSIRGGQGFAIAGLRDGIDGSFIVSVATHSYTKDAGLLTTVQFQDPQTGADFSEAGTTEDAEPEYSAT